MSLRRSSPAWLLLTLGALLTACPGTDEDALCGNGIVEGSEQCDDGNTRNDDGCSNLCTVSVCGNGVVEPGEQCDDGNTVSGDGCETTCRLPTAHTTCAGADALPRPSAGACSVTSGGNGSVLITGVILGDGETFVGGQVLYGADGALQCVGCGCDAEPSAAEATKLVCPEVVVSPGLINAHDHLTYQRPPYIPTSDERFEHRHDWRTGQNNHTAINPPGNASTDTKIWAELRQVMAGTTSLNGSGNAPGLMRNLDQSGHLLGLDTDQVLYETFPLGSNDQLIASCNYPVNGPERSTGAWTPHVAEGIEESARNELRCLYGTASSPGYAHLSRTAVIHATGASATEAAWLAAGGASVIWSPRTNVSLYGDTAPVPVFHRLGLNVGMGTDWLFSGSMNMLRELQCADLLNQSYWGKALTDEDLWRIATTGGADALKVGHRIGRLKAGHVADLALFTLRGFAQNPHRAVITAGPADVVLTVRGGKALYGDTALTEALIGGCAALDVCGSPKGICLGGEVSKSFAELQASQASSYGLFACATPPDEPTCVPSRTSTNASWPASTFGSSVYTGQPSAGDADGDGVPDAEDNCQGVFNPVRPMDFGRQADVDGDGIGDMCDPCPLNAGSTCTGLADGDRDGDGVPDAQDVCPLVADDQSDTDGDGKGDACDLCPTSNPGDAICSLGIADFKQPVSHTVLLAGETVEVKNVIVTGVFAGAGGGFFVQERNPDPVTGWKNRGLFVFAPSTQESPWPTALAVGDVVDLIGDVTVYYGQVQLKDARWNKVATNAALPAPLVATTEELMTGSALAPELEGVLVRVEDVTVTDIAPPAGGGDRSPTGEYVVTGEGLSGGLRVDNFLFTSMAIPELGTGYASVTGVLTLRNDHFKIEPRDAADLVLGSVRVKSLLPARSFARIGTTGATVPEALTVTLDRVVSVDTEVTVTSAQPGLLTASSVTVPAGSSTAVVPVTGLAAGTATVSAALPDGPVRTATVEVIAADAQPSLVEFTTSATTVAQGTTVTFTVTLDLPGATDSVVALATSGAGGLAVPATLTVPANALSTSFDVVAGSPGAVTVTASLGGASRNLAMTVVEPSTGGLVINEVDYDQIGADTTEFIELYNAGTTPVSLVGKQLRFINGSGSGSEYFVLPGNAVMDLAAAGAELAAGGFLLVHPPEVALPPGVLSITFATISGGSIQNGAPDAIGIWDTITGTWVDRLSWEGDTRFEGASMAEGPAPTADFKDPGSANVQESLVRMPDGADTDVNVDDFSLSLNPTPGLPNRL